MKPCQKCLELIYREEDMEFSLCRDCRVERGIAIGVWIILTVGAICLIPLFFSK